ncbi:disease resistance protein TAO1-like [Senna tora]|uniref:Disease resistance protein TAO1-like n=1 Tax=Senna tora TaxID=362788 RepID=A0A835C8Q4_9FABA|nr:disease resistance protein TAO1-like [Senna tora]
MSPECDDDDVVNISSTPGAFRLKWDVFLSFRGADTRDSLTRHLYDALLSRGVRVFRDDDGLDRGDEIAPCLLEAIDDSAASIIILSPNYASSHWCLEELAKICDCRRLILPVFYRVDPSHVRKQKGPFERCFEIHESRFPEDEVIRWRKAMERVGGIAGWVFQNHNSSEEDVLIRLLVKRVLKELSNTPMGVAEFTVGLEGRIEELTNLLDLKSNNGLRVLGLFGMGGIGKTTLAKALFNSLVTHFEHRCFISSVRQVSPKHLLNRIVSDISNGNGNGISAFRRTVHENRVLIILDDVDDLKQLDMVIGEREWFYEGSLIVITTRDTQVLPDTYVNVLYEVKELGNSEALELFCYHAMRRKEPSDNTLLKLSEKMVSLTGRLPLALQVFGSLLFGKRRVEEWVDMVEKLKRIRPGNLQDVLRISYEGLDEQEKCVFLHVACLFVQMGMKRGDVVDVVRGCGLRGEIAITILTEKCLVKIREEDDSVCMHDQIRDMGRQIVVDENLVDPGLRSRLWDRSEILTVLKNLKGTRSIQGMVLDLEERSVKDKGEGIGGNNKLQWRSSLGNVLAYISSHNNKRCCEKDEEEEVVVHTNCFESMTNLALLQINNLRLEGKFKCFPAELKWLQWQGCTLNCMPSDFWPQELAAPKNIMVMNLSHCCQLESVPDLSECTRLEKIDLENCIKLNRIHESIGNLTTLRHLNLTRCTDLIELPTNISGLKNLENLLLSGCSKFKALPTDMTTFTSLTTLLADGTALTELPHTIFRLEKLQYLVLDGCKDLKRLPHNIGHLSSLQELTLDISGIEELPNSVGCLENLEKLSLMHCQSLTEIPDSIGNLASLSQLWLNGSAIRELPASIGSLCYLKDLSVGNCKLLSELPECVKSFASIVELQLDGTAITDLPDGIGGMRTLRRLDMRNCRHLRSLPESIGHLAALTTLNIFNANIIELPESFGMLENLVVLRLNKCRMLRKLPDSIGCLKSLYHLMMEETGVTELPESFGMLTNLRTLKMAKKSPENKQDSFEISSSSFCNMIFLTDLDARAWGIYGKIPDGFEKLSFLETLNLSQNNFHSLPSSLEGLSFLKKLVLRNCINLLSLPPLPSSLIEVNAENCCAMESIHDLSKLRSLQELNLTNCVKVVDIPGLEWLKSMRRLYLSGCIACSSTISKRISKAALRNLESLSMPGTRLPKWFSGQSVSFSKPKNRELTGVIVGIVVSINHKIPNEMRPDLPGVVDVQANVLKLGKTVFTSVLNLHGLPTTNDPHIHFCRYLDYHPLISFLRDGDTFCVTKRNPPVDEGLELEKCGVHLLFEGDDDYDGDEDCLDTSLQSVSEKLAKFFSTCEEEDEIESQEASEMERESSSYITSNSTCLSFVGIFVLMMSCVRVNLGILMHDGVVDPGKCSRLWDRLQIMAALKRMVMNIGPDRLVQLKNR